MIYLKRTLWLLGHPMVWLLSCVLLMIEFIFICFNSIFLYIKNGNIEGYDNCLDCGFKLIKWYDDIEPKED